MSLPGFRISLCIFHSEIVLIVPDGASVLVHLYIVFFFFLFSKQINSVLQIIMGKKDNLGIFFHSTY